MSVTSRDDVFINLAKGKGQHLIGIGVSVGTVTTANAASGFFQFGIGSNAIGSTWPGTLVDFPEQPSPPHELMNTFFFGNSAVSGRFSWLARFYLIGTLNTAATGNQFTHDAATYPLLRKVYGAANTAIDLIPVINTTTTMTTTSPQYIIKDSGGSAGYTNQDGTAVVGTKTTTLPLPVAGTCNIMRLEDGDCAVQDITQIDVTVASAAGAANIYGMELIAPMMSVVSGFGSLQDGLFGGLGMQNIAPAVATSGTVTSFLGLVGPSTTPQTASFYHCSALNV